ncbi:SNF2 family N-terminal domain-containing protein [Tricladium varicosporioides]|nr:SNF2 family N-terminal domain-containing protein [Hymenoscyphus varicosporioides]
MSSQKSIALWSGFENSDEINQSLLPDDTNSAKRMMNTDHLGELIETKSAKRRRLQQEEKSASAKPGGLTDHGLPHELPPLIPTSPSAVCYSEYPPPVSYPRTQSAEVNMSDSTYENVVEVSAIDHSLSHTGNKKGVANGSLEPIEDVCFGMLTNIPVELLHLEQATSCTGVVLDDSGVLFKAVGLGRFGKIDKRTAKILRALGEERSISTQLYCQIKPDRNSAELSAIIYGTPEMFEPIGNFAQECGMYLQDPLHWDRKVRYCNPHRMFSFDEALATSSLTDDPAPLHLEEVASNADLWSEFESNEELPETEGPSIVSTILLRHQKQALTFMMRREQGWALEGPRKDIWKIMIAANKQFLYTNTITGSQQDYPPPSFRGGILADQMGLGKSLSMISLIASDTTRPLKDPTPETSVVTTEPKVPAIKTTLLVVPSSLLHTWRHELKRHLRPNTLKWQFFYGQRRSTDTVALTLCDIVVTTYGTILSEWKKHIKTPTSCLFLLLWHRVVLDEAHIIRGNSTLNANAVCALKAVCRWAMTGTPIQNRLTDLGSLFKFLRVHPFSDPKIFHAEISQNWDQKAFVKLKSLVRILALSRSKTVIKLPGRKDLIQYLEFNESEKNTYDAAKVRTAQVLQSTIAMDSEQPASYLNALQWINTLRLICNHGTGEWKHSDSGLDIKSPWEKSVAEDGFQTLMCAEAAACILCGTQIVNSTYDGFESHVNEYLPPVISTCFQLYCGLCFQESDDQSVSTSHICEHGSSCTMTPVSLDQVSRSFGHDSNIIHAAPIVVPTKVRALLEDLKSYKEEKSVVFSYWTTTLDLVESTLKSSFISYSRLDGRMPMEKRAEALMVFRLEPTVRVMLVSTTCGGLGLDLTVASRAYLMEPQWNPMVEEQALARIYRIGQNKRVTTIRYIMKDSIEKNIIAIQHRKKTIADLALSNVPLSEMNVGESQLEYLRSVIR